MNYGPNDQRQVPAGMVGKQMPPFLVADKGYRERLHHYTDVFANANLITLHGDDPVELQLAAQSLAVETRRARIWEVRSEASIHSVLRKIARARRPGSDVTIILSRDIGVDSAREFYKSMPPDYAMIKLSARLDNHVVSINQALDADPSIEEIRALCEHSVRQHATMMEDAGEFLSYDDLVRNYERTILRRALTQYDWNLSATARSLGLAESSLRYKLKKLGVTRRNASGQL